MPKLVRKQYQRNSHLLKVILFTALLGIFLLGYLGSQFSSHSIGAPEDILASTTPTALVAGPVSFEGKFSVVAADDFTHQISRTLYYIKDLDNGQNVEVSPGDVKLTVKTGDTVKIAGDYDGKIVKATSITKSHPLTSLLAQSATKTKKVLVVLFNFDDTAAQPVTSDFVRQQIFAGNPSVNSSLQENSFNQFKLTGNQSANGDVAGWFTIPKTGNTCQFMDWTEAADAAAAANDIDVKNYQTVIYAFPADGKNCGWSGMANPGGSLAFTRAWLPIETADNYSSSDGSTFRSVVLHEMGHVLGMPNANSLTCKDKAGTPVAIGANCTSKEYGDPFDPMGNAKPEDSFSNINKSWSLGQYASKWLANNNQFSTAKSGTFDIYPIETSSPHVQLLIPRTLKNLTYSQADGSHTDPGYYYVEYRQSAPNGILIRFGSSLANHDNANTQLIDTTPSSSSNCDACDAPLLVGKTFTDSQTGVSITLDSTSEGKATVTLVVPKPAPKPSVTIDTVLPFYGPSTGGNKIVISGNNLLGADGKATVYFNSVMASVDYTASTATQLVVTAPSYKRPSNQIGPPNDRVNVKVTNTIGSRTSVKAYLYILSGQ